MQAQGIKTHSGHFPWQTEDLASAAGLGRGWQDRMGLGPAHEGLQCPRVSRVVVLDLSARTLRHLGRFSKVQSSGDFPGGLVVSTALFHCRGGQVKQVAPSEQVPLSRGTKILQAT